MRVSDTTRVINRIFNFYSSLGVDFRSIAELEITNSYGTTKIDFLIMIIGQPYEYGAFELKYNRKNIQDLTLFQSSELSQIQEMIQRVQGQYQKITNLVPTDWNSIQFPQPLGNVNKIYVFINSLFINEFLSVIKFNTTRDSFFSLEKQGRTYIRGSFEGIHFPNAANLITYITTNEELLVIPFTLIDLDYKNADNIPFSEVSRNQGRLLLSLSKSFLREKISTLEKKFKIDEFYESIFGEIEDRFSFGRDDKKNLEKILTKYCKLLSEMTYYKDRKVLTLVGDSFRINIRNSPSRDKVLDKVEKYIQEKISIKTLDDFFELKKN